MTDSATTAPQYWGQKAAEYDDFIRRVVPRYDELTDRLLASIPKSAPRVIELGCGTGNLSLRLIDALPDARFTFLDASPEMLAITRSRVERSAPGVLERTHFLEARFEDLGTSDEQWDLAIASLSIHHMETPEPLYHALARSLTPHGALCMSDGLLAASPEHHAMHMRLWEEYWRSPGKLDEAEIASVRDHIERHDHYHTLEAHFRWLSGAGFRNPDCLWRDALFAVVTAELG